MTSSCDFSRFHSREATRQHKTCTYGTVLGIYGDAVPQETRGGCGRGGSCDLRSIRAAPVHITQQAGGRLLTREEMLLKETKAGGWGGALRFSSHRVKVVNHVMRGRRARLREEKLSRRRTSAADEGEDGQNQQTKPNRLWRKQNCTSTNTSGRSSFFHSCVAFKGLFDWNQMTQETKGRKKIHIFHFCSFSRGIIKMKKKM